MLHRDHEGELDARQVFRALLRVGRRRLDPQDVLEPIVKPVIRTGSGTIVDRHDPTFLVVQLIKAGVDRDAVQPRAQRAAALELGPAPQSPQADLLQHILRIVVRAEQAVAVREQLRPIRPKRVLGLQHLHAPDHDRAARRATGARCKDVAQHARAGGSPHAVMSQLRFPYWRWVT